MGIHYCLLVNHFNSLYVYMFRIWVNWVNCIQVPAMHPASEKVPLEFSIVPSSNIPAKANLLVYNIGYFTS